MLNNAWVNIQATNQTFINPSQKASQGIVEIVQIILKHANKMLIHIKVPK